MSDFDFEARLERLYAQPPRVSDPEGFTRRVGDRLEREWTLRRWAISALGLAGAAVAVSQTLGSETVTRFAAMAEPARKVAAESVAAQDWVRSLESAETWRVISEPSVWLTATAAPARPRAPIASRRSVHSRSSRSDTLRVKPSGSLTRGGWA